MNQKESQYLEYIRAHVPGMSLDHVVFDFINGEHSDMVLVDEREVFKFSKFDWSAGYLNNAVKAINLIQNYVDIPLPRVNSLEPGVAEMNFVRGEPLCRSDVSLLKGYEQVALARQLGTFLSRMHGIPLKEAKACRLEQDDMEKMNTKYWESEYREIQSKIFAYCDNYTKDYVRRLFESALADEEFFLYTPSVIHGNLTPRHMIYSKESNRVVSIAGFGSCRIGDPAYDTGMLLFGFGEAFLKRITQFDRSIPDQMERARFYACYQSVSWAKELADRISTRDFTNFKINLAEADIMPVAKLSGRR